MVFGQEFFKGGLGSKSKTNALMPDTCSNLVGPACQTEHEKE